MIKTKQTNYNKTDWLEKVMKATAIELRMEQVHLKETVNAFNTDPYEYIEDSRVKYPQVNSWQEKEATRPAKDGWLPIDFLGFTNDGMPVNAGAYRRLRSKGAMYLNDIYKQNAQDRIYMIDQIIADRAMISSIL